MILNNYAMKTSSFLWLLYLLVLLYSIPRGHTFAVGAESSLPYRRFASQKCQALLQPDHVSSLTDTVPSTVFPSASTLSSIIARIRHVPVPVRALFSSLLAYGSLVIICDRPQGGLWIDCDSVRVRPSTVPGAGLGLFAHRNLHKGQILGAYPGVVMPLQQQQQQAFASNKRILFPHCEKYVWRFSDSQCIIDPTNAQGMLEETVIGGNPSQFASVWLFTSALSKVTLHGTPATNSDNNFRVCTSLCRINEPPKGQDVNVVTTEDLRRRRVVFTLDRDVAQGEELFMDYGLYYDRSSYQPINNYQQQSLE